MEGLKKKTFTASFKQGTMPTSLKSSTQKPLPRFKHMNVKQPVQKGSVVAPGRRTVLAHNASLKSFESQEYNNSTEEVTEQALRQSQSQMKVGIDNRRNQSMIKREIIDAININNLGKQSL